MLPDHTDPEHKRMRKYSTYVLSLMPKKLKMEYWPTMPEIYEQDGEMSVIDFQTQYELQFVDSGSSFLSKDDFEQLRNGDYFAGAANGTDSTAISILRLDKLTQQRQKIFAVELKGMPFPQQMKIILSLFTGPRPKFRYKKIVADATGVGLGLIQVMKDQGLDIIPITFNAKDRFTNTNTNYKTTMYRAILAAIQNDKFKYPSLDNVPKNDHVFLHKQLMQWSDLVVKKITGSNNISVESSTTNEDHADADALSYFATVIDQKQHRMPNGITYRSSR